MSIEERIYKAADLLHQRTRLWRLYYFLRDWPNTPNREAWCNAVMREITNVDHAIAMCLVHDLNLTVVSGGNPTTTRTRKPPSKEIVGQWAMKKQVLQR